MKTRSKALHFLVFFLIITKAMSLVLGFCLWGNIILNLAVVGRGYEPPFTFFLVFGLLMLLQVLVLFPLGILFYILMIIDAVKRKFAPESDRTLWIVLVAVSIMLWFIPAYVYYFLHGRKPREIPELKPVE